MKLRILSIVFLVLALAMSSCGTSATPSPPSEPHTVQDQASLLSFLQAAGATVETGDSITQEFFTPEGQTLKVNGTDLQVFEYESAEAMEKRPPRLHLMVGLLEHLWSLGSIYLTSIKLAASSFCILGTTRHSWICLTR